MIERFEFSRLPLFLTSLVGIYRFWSTGSIGERAHCLPYYGVNQRIIMALLARRDIDAAVLACACAWR